jgi:hypothetical protein
MAAPLLVAKNATTGKSVTLKSLAQRFSPIGSQLGREILRGISGSVLAGKRR